VTVTVPVPVPVNNPAARTRHVFEVVRRGAKSENA
jgi:hypothetical protein